MMVGDFETDKVSTIVTFGICSCKQSQNNKILTSTDDDIGGSNLQKSQKKTRTIDIMPMHQLRMVMDMVLTS